MNNKAEIASEVMKNAPTTIVAGLSLWGIPISDWLILLTIVYTLFQLNTHLNKNGYYKKWVSLLRGKRRT